MGKGLSIKPSQKIQTLARLPPTGDLMQPPIMELSPAERRMGRVMSKLLGAATAAARELAHTSVLFVLASRAAIQQHRSATRFRSGCYRRLRLAINAVGLLLHLHVIIAITLLPASFCLAQAAARSRGMTFAYKEDDLPGMDFRFIHATGTFVNGTAEEFQSFVQRRRIEGGAVVILDSDGGSVAEALSMGRIIRRKGFNTEVDDGGGCFSSCTIAFLGDIRRSVFGQFGVHRVSSSAHLSPEEALDIGQIALAEIAKYAADMGVSPDYVLALTSVGSADINLLSREQMKEYKIITALYTTNWEFRNKAGFFYLLAATDANNGYHKMIFACDGRGGLNMLILYNTTGEYRHDVLKYTSIYQLEIDDHKHTLDNRELIRRAEKSGPGYVSVEVHISGKLLQLLIAARHVRFMMLPLLT
jgi:hypothetical protein